ncbi:hypothetical protein BC830DRAFT_1140696 [Chytriomyces sp. MP71]|nr:hypothetical protein BC830DRAFT_1140696 [Chytriomyces sp. MP71]
MPRRNYFSTNHWPKHDCIMKDIISFGDSFTDTGNLFRAKAVPPLPYYKGRFSDGPVWVEYVAMYAGNATLHDYAFGGACANATDSHLTGPYANIPDLSAQIRTFKGDAIASTFDPSETVFTVFAGVNDFINAATDSTPHIPDANAIAGTVVNAIDSLASLNARDILLVNMPPIEIAPEVKPLVQYTSVIQLLVGTFNGAINTGASKLMAKYQGLTVTILDFNGMLKFAVTPEGMQAFNLTDVTNACLDKSNNICSSPESHLFWDDVHPTTQGHMYVAQFAYNVLNNRTGYLAPASVVMTQTVASRVPVATNSQSVSREGGLPLSSSIPQANSASPPLILNLISLAVALALVL